jgi:hypothetical protein
MSRLEYMQKCKEASEVGIPVFFTEEECQWLCNQMDIIFACLPEKSSEATAQDKADLCQRNWKEYRRTRRNERGLHQSPSSQASILGSI